MCGVDMTIRAENNNAHFFLGLVTGSVLGAGLAIAFAPKLAAELRERVTAAAGDLGDTASKRYQEMSARVVGNVEAVTARGQAVRDEVADVVVRGARSVEQFAAASKSDSKRGSPGDGGGLCATVGWRCPPRSDTGSTLTCDFGA